LWRAVWVGNITLGLHHLWFDIHHHGRLRCMLRASPQQLANAIIQRRYDSRTLHEYIDWSHKVAFDTRTVGQSMDGTL